MQSKSSLPENLVTVLGLFLLAANSALANGFSVLVSPPRFELSGKPGEVLRNYVEINNPNNRPISLELRTADWDMSESGATTFYPPELQPGSCRPWARIERHQMHLPAQVTRRYRFQIDIPADAPAGECRLALLLEAPREDAVIAQADTLNIPVQGRLAVVMYIAVDDASPDLEVQEVLLDDSNGEQSPVVIVHNRGNAHARTAGFVDATDAAGRRLEFAVASLPILPGQTRRVPLRRADAEGGEAAAFVPPLDMQGAIEWETGKQAIRTRIGQAPLTD
jgi:hypothetical protein